MGKKNVLRMVGLLVLLSSGIALAQVSTGTISGTVKDNSGAAVRGATVVIQNEGTQISRKVTTDDGGRYTAPSLGVGQYSVTVGQEGFRTEVRSGIVLTVGREAIVDLSLTVGAVTQTVKVTGDAPVVESTTGSLGSLVDDHTMRALPLNGRSYDQLALLQPGVVLTEPGHTGGTSLTFGSGKRFSVGGQRSYANSFLLDGTNVNDQANGTPGGAAGTNLGVDTILEFKIFTNSFKAEYGHSSGSVISAITRTGTNTLHGTAFEYIRNSALDARNFFDPGTSPPSFKRNQFGGVLGGPIKKDKTFFFGGYEGLRQGLGTTLIQTVPTALAKKGILPCTGSTPCVNGTMTVPVNPAVVPYLNLYPFPNGRDFGDGTAQFLASPPIITNEDYFMIRGDHQLTDKTGIFARYTSDVDELNDTVPLPSISTIETDRRQYATMQAISVLSSKALNHFLFAFNRTRPFFYQLSIPDPGPAYAIVPGQSMGSIQLGSISSSGATRALTPLGTSNGNGPMAWAYNIFQWGDDFTYVTGKHSLKFGVDIQRMQDNANNPNSVAGALTFTSFNTFLAGTPSNMQANSPLGVAPYFGYRQSMYGVYGQDDYTVNSRLTLNLGLRWETATDPHDANGHASILPSPSATAMVSSDTYFSIVKKNFEPRFGIAWRLNHSGKTVLRAGGGIYHDQILPYVYWTNTSNPPYFGRFNATNPPFPNPYLALTGGGLLNPQVMALVNKTPVVDQYTLSIQQEIFRNTVVQVAYAGNHSNHQLTQREVDTATPIFCTSSPSNCPSGMLPGQPPIYYPAGSPRLNPAWAGIRFYSMTGNSYYNSGTVTLRRQFSSGFVGQIFYTYSKAMDEASNAAGADSVRSPSALLDPYDPAFDWGLSEFDSRNAVIANFSYLLPFRAGEKVLGAVVNGWTFDGITTFESGQPFTPRNAKAVSNDLASQLAERPNLNPGFSSNPTHGISKGCPGFAAGTPVGNANNWYDPCAFSLPLSGTYGNLRRNSVIGPGVEDVDLALEKGFSLPEKANGTFRAEMFNVMNHANKFWSSGQPTPLSATVVQC